MRSLIRTLAEEIAAGGGRAYYVGGCVRDRLLGLPSLDLDIEVYGLPLAALEALLARHGRVQAVGRTFGILKFRARRGGEADFGLPRRESLSGRGHRGFTVDLDPSITPREACARRDFTVNAMLEDVLTGEVHDFFGGRADLAARRLRHTSPAFSEDPLRVYRLMQLGARYALDPAPETLALCREMDLGALAPERVYAEFEKLLLLAAAPSRGLAVARAAGVLAFHPELAAMIGCPQDPDWHPEGDVWTHTLLVVDAAARLRTGDRRLDLALMFGALCHDLGKPLTTHRKQGRILSPGHTEAGEEPARRFLGRLTQDGELIEAVLRFVRLHLRPAEFYRVREEIGDGAIRRLATEVNIVELVLLARADHLGRTTADALAGEFPAGDWLLAKAAELAVEREAPAPLLMGRHLLEAGWQPGPAVGEAVNAAYEAQLEEAFVDLHGALVWLERWLAERPSRRSPWRRDGDI
ncbi:HD domain-containing protein [bacterium]|nr:HD domain-containing protein [bacterium]